MIKRLLLVASAFCFVNIGSAQNVASFDELPLGTDTFYLDMDTNGYSFNSGLVTLFGKFTQETWGIGGLGFTYSNKVDTTQCLNCYDLDYQMSSRPGSGYNSSMYAVAFTYEPAGIKLQPTPADHPVEFGSAMFANTSWGFAYANVNFNEANEGWAKITVKGFIQGQASGDSLDIFLADFRASTPAANRGILNNWKLVSLSSFSSADSLSFVVNSSDDWFPAYFAIDDIETPSKTSVKSVNQLNAAVFPNPTNSKVQIQYELPLNILVVDMQGRTVIQESSTNEIDMTKLASGTYLFKITSLDGTKTSHILVNKL